MNKIQRKAIVIVSLFFILLVIVGTVLFINQIRRENRKYFNTIKNNHAAVSAVTPIISPTVAIEDRFISREAGASASITQGINQKTAAKVTRVIDGDTFEIEGGKKVRMIGMDTPETVDPNRKVGCFGPEASVKTKELLTGATVEMEQDISDTDRYGRLLRYVYKNGVFINDLLVREGYAIIATYPPDVKYVDIFHQAETEARKNNRGLWGKCVK